MIRRFPRPVAAPAWALALALALALPCAAPAAAAPARLPDSTFVDQWTLSNGLRVTARHVPYATSVVVTVAYGTGSAADPAGREGLAWLLAELQFTGAAGEVPDRTRPEIDSQRPLGWRVKVLPRATLFSETATPAQYPVVLHQAAQRMRGVTLTAPHVQAAVERVRPEVRRLFRDAPDSAAYALPFAIAAGADAAALQRLMDGAGVVALAPKEAQRLLAERFVPANAVLSIVGDLGPIDLRAFVEREFGGIPAGKAPAPTSIALQPLARTLSLPGLERPVCAFGLIAPSLHDADHPEFYLAVLLMGSRARGMWYPTLPPISSPFKFALFDDPDLVRFYPPADPVRTDTTWVGDRMEEILDPMARTVMPDDAVDQMKRGVYWLLGGPMMPTVLRQARVDGALLYSLSTSMATRTLWGDEAFWEGYRNRFAAIQQVPLEAWVDYALKRRDQVRVVLTPAR